jgi:hypothetical protein
MILLRFLDVARVEPRVGACAVDAAEPATSAAVPRRRNALRMDSLFFRYGCVLTLNDLNER